VRKSTAAGIIAAQLDGDLQEGDDLHPAANVEKTELGVLLDDHDRWPWLNQGAHWIDAQAAAGQAGIITCSAIKRKISRPNPG
jgi:gluconokinase